MAECPRFSKWFGGCKFEARYDEKKQRRQLGMASDWPEWFSETLTVNGKRVEATPRSTPTDSITYVRDVCVRCGKSIERVPTTPEAG